MVEEMVQKKTKNKKKNAFLKTIQIVMGGGDFKVKLQASKTLLAEKSGYSILIIVALREIKHKSFFSFNLTVKSAKHEAQS